MGCARKAANMKTFLNPLKSIMKITHRSPGLALVLTVLAGQALAQARPAAFDPGKREFDNSCASCHGSAGKGDGPLVPFLTRSPPDLTLLAKRNAEYFMEAPYNAEAHVRARILGLLEYINRIQAK